jgi:hypothetical protein
MAMKTWTASTIAVASGNLSASGLGGFYFLNIQAVAEVPIVPTKILVSGFTNPANNGEFTVATVTNFTITTVEGGLVDEAEGDSVTISVTEGGVGGGLPLFPALLGGGSAEIWDKNWTAAQKAYARQNFGYWCDENGFADPTDPESYLASTWI